MCRSLFPRRGELRKEVPYVYQVVIEDLPGIVK
jgi:hypothetical protein